MAEKKNAREREYSVTKCRKFTSKELRETSTYCLYASIMPDSLYTVKQSHYLGSQAIKQGKQECRGKGKNNHEYFRIHQTLHASA